LIYTGLVCWQEKKMLNEVSRLFRALSKPKRLRILKLVEAGETYGAEVAATLGMSYTNACHHFREMAAVGLVEAREAGARIFYSIPRGAEPGARLARMACAWLDGDERVGKDLRRLAQERRKLTERSD
jgi:DNA-binding transcriptional ArsR family regulator